MTFFILIQSGRYIARAGTTGRRGSISIGGIGVITTVGYIFKIIGSFLVLFSFVIFSFLVFSFLFFISIFPSLVIIVSKSPTTFRTKCLISSRKGIFRAWVIAFYFIFTVIAGKFGIFFGTSVGISIASCFSCRCWFGGLTGLFSPFLVKKTSIPSPSINLNEKNYFGGKFF